VLHTDTVTVLVTTYGEPVEGIPSESTERRVIDEVNVQPVGTNESIGEPGGPVTSRWRVSTTSLADWVSDHDHVEWNGETFEVLGRPQTFRHGIPHTEFIITETRG
jgi:hypothetical protein